MEFLQLNKMEYKKEAEYAKKRHKTAESGSPLPARPVRRASERGWG